MLATIFRSMRFWTPAAKNGRTPERPISATERIHTTIVSGPNTAASSSPAGSTDGDPYRAVCDELYALLTRKRGYYGCREDPLANALGVEEDGIPAWKYQVARVGEKTRRLRGELSAIDIQKTLLDIAGHAVVAIACERRRGGDHVLRRATRSGG